MTGFARPELLVETAWLADHLDDPSVRIVDTRWTGDRLGPTGRESYLTAHIPGAVYADWATELADPGDPVRGMIAQADRFANLMGRLGIGNDTTVIAYDDASGPFATRLWWALKYYGHDRVHVLHGGIGKWTGEGRATAAGQAFHGARVYQPNPRYELRVGAEMVLKALGQPDVMIVDARTPAQYAGHESAGALRIGHIPGAVNIPISANFAGNPATFRSADELRDLYGCAGIERARLVIATCAAGVAAAGTAFALNLLGYDNVAVYDGSWAEWGNNPSLPIEH